LKRRYVTVDVFTDKQFGGNPLAVVLDAEGLSGAQMQSIATEFNYAETTFVLPPRDPAHTAQVRIFTARVEIPFAGHPNVGTAVVLARELETAGRSPVDRFVFEEGAGPVSVRLIRSAGSVVAAELTAPKPLSIGATASVQDAAASLSLSSADICTAAHSPQVLSVGLPFLVIEVVSRDALRRARPNVLVHERILPSMGTDAVFAYVHGARSGDLHARVFAPLDGSPEDPATGSANAAAIAQLTQLRAEADCELAWRIEQGVDMGRPSLLIGRTEKRGGQVTAVRIAGNAMPVMQGVLQID
jgi:trans-2,3-dihydro-3-hydroxyanthranilate isomerase